MDGVMSVTGAAVFVPALAALVLGAGGGAAPRDDPQQGGSPAAGAAAHRARLVPLVGATFRVRGSGFRARERVRVTVTASAGDPVVRRVRATGRGTFVLAFSGIEACGGVAGAATGSRGSRASFQFSTFTC
jgi:hypothetical protein